MKKAKIVILSQILILSSLFMTPVLTHQAHASPSGLICIAPDGATSCPSIPPVLTRILNNTQLRVALIISNSSAINGFDITVLTAHSILKPAGVDLTGSVLLGTPGIIVKCIGGILTQGAACSPTDTVDTIHIAANNAIGTGNTVPPTTGLLFTAIYNITGTGSTAPLAFQTGCSNTSVTGGLCITIFNGSATAVPETAQTASFSNIPGVPSFATNANPSSLSLVRGTSGSSQIIVTSLNNFTGFVNLSTSVAPLGPTTTLGLSSLLIPPNGQNFTTLNVNTGSTLAAGIYNVTISAKSGSLATSTLVRVAVTTTQPTPDFTFSANPVSLSFGQGTSANTTLTATSTGGFAGTVMIGFTNFVGNASAGLQEEWFNTIVLSVGGSGSSHLFVTAAFNTQPGFDNFTLTATSGALSHPVTIHFHVTPLPAFEVRQQTIATVFVPQGSSNSTIMQVSTNSLFNGTIALTTISSGTGLSLVLNRTSLKMGPNQVTTVTLTLSAAFSTLPGVYFVNVIGTSGSMRQAGYMNVIVTGVTPPPSPDFTITANPSFLATPAGTNVSSTITLGGLNGFSGKINLTATVTPSTLNQPSAILIPATVSLPANGTATATLFLSTSVLTPGLFYTITVTGFGGGKTHFANVSLQVLAPPDENPTANFTFAPSNPVVAQSVSFDGSGSFDPDGSIVSWSWSFGDGSFCSCGEFTSHTYFNSGSYTVTLTVSDSSGSFSSKSVTIFVSPRPAHDVGIIQISPYPTRVVATQTVGIQLELTNTGSSNETVTLVAYANGRAVQTVRGIFLQACNPNGFFCNNVYYLQVTWDTSGVAAGNYTISASISLPAGEVDPTPADNNISDGTVTVLPAPIISLSPSTGVDGTKVQIQGTGFPLPQQFFYGPTGLVEVNFDNMSLGFTFTHNGTFTFTFNVLLSQPGTHGIFAYDPYSGAHASATFTVQPTPTGTLAVSIDMGTIYFPGDTATAYILTTFNGAQVNPSSVQLQVVLFKPDGTNLTLTATSLGSGLYKANYPIPSTGPILGTYLVLAKAHQPGPIDASALVSFEIKLTWTNSNSGKITIGATTLAGVIGIGAVAWKKGYLRRKTDKEAPSTFPF